MRGEVPGLYFCAASISLSIDGREELDLEESPNLIQQQRSEDAIEKPSRHRVGVVVYTALSRQVHHKEQMAARMARALTKRQP
eukprot:5180897-Pleurochrysis_carterae.AAC.2